MDELAIISPLSFANIKAEKEAERSCMNCKYESEPFDRFPCRACTRVGMSRWEPKSEVMP